MNAKKKLPKIFKLLSKHFGARKATEMMKGIILTSEYDFDNKTNYISSSFVFAQTNQGHKYWIKVVRKVHPMWY